MPVKFHEAHRHRVPRARYRVRNWSQDDRGLARRGDIRVWLSLDAIIGSRASIRVTLGA
jgi:hypothetical protein